MQIGGSSRDHLFSAKQRNFREAFLADNRGGGNRASVFALRQHDSLRP